jgi:hypothetical protein
MLDTMRHCDHFDSAIVHGQADRASKVAAHRLAHEGNTVSLQHLPGGHEVPLPHVYGARRRQGREHAGPAGEPGGDASRLRPVGYHQFEKAGDRRLGELGGVGVYPA